MSELVEFIGDIDEWLNRVNEVVHEAVSEATHSIVDEVVALSKDLAPVESGNLRDHIKGEVSTGGHFGRVRISHKDVPYAPYVIFGSVHNNPNPFVYTAADQVGVSYPKKVKEKIKTKAEEGNEHE